jgi:hypothetical protein
VYYIQCYWVPGLYPFTSIQGRIQRFLKSTLLRPQVNMLEACALLCALERADLRHCRTCRAFPNHYQRTEKDLFLKLCVLSLVPRSWTLSFQSTCMISSSYEHTGLLVKYSWTNNRIGVHYTDLGRVTIPIGFWEWCMTFRNTLVLEFLHRQM